MNLKGVFSSNSDEWFTPSWLVDRLKSEFDFTLDPCGCEESHICDKYYSILDDGLLKSWKNEVVFVNPPYSQINKWVKKCYDEFILNNTTIVLLIPARVDTAYFHDFIYGVCEIRFIRGRLKFSNSKNSAPFPSMICVFSGDSYGKFICSRI